jgi:hypothetical protein
MNGDVTHAYLDNNTVAIPEPLKGIASLTEEMRGEGLSVTDSTHCIYKIALCSRSSNVGSRNQRGSS